MTEQKFYGPEERTIAGPDPSTYIPLKDCKRGFLYRIDARNAIFGIFQGGTAFEIVRKKYPDFGPFLSVEYHYDMGGPFGTVLPVKELEECPPDILDDINSARRLAWLEQKKREYTL
jgi:hypothetical protein